MVRAPGEGSRESLPEAMAIVGSRDSKGVNWGSKSGRVGRGQIEKHCKAKIVRIWGMKELKMNPRDQVSGRRREEGDPKTSIR